MKRLLLMIIAILSLSSCGYLDIQLRIGPDSSVERYLTPEIEEAISYMYPYAEILSIEHDTFIEVEIRHERLYKDVYFDYHNIWIRTEVELNKKNLPKVLKDAIEKSEYKDWRVDEAELIEMPDEEIYIAELHKYGKEAEIRISIKH